MKDQSKDDAVPLLWGTLPDGEPYLMYKAFPKQVEFHQSPITNLLAIGSRGSGKSLMLRHDAHMRALSVPNCNIILIRKTMQQLEQSHLLNIRQEMKLLGGDYNGTAHRCDYPNGSKLFFSYVGHAGDALNLLSAEFLAAYYDELSVIPWDYFMKLNASVRVSGAMRDAGLKAVIRAATNPLGESAAECMKYFVDQDVNLSEEPDYDWQEWSHVRIDMEDNPFLDIGQYRKRFANQPEHIKAAWLRGEYMEENALFKFFPTKDDRPYHVIKDLSLEDIVKKARIYRAYDHGYNPDPAYCVWIAHLGNRYIAFHEKKWNGRIVSEIAQLIKEEDELLGINTPDNPNRVIATFCDPSIDIQTGADVRTIKGIFESHGIPMECSVNNREHYAAVIHEALSEEAEPGIPTLQIYEGNTSWLPGCRYLIKTIPLQKWDDKHPERLANNHHDHAVISMAYFLMSHQSDEHKSYKPKSVKPWMRPKRESRWILGNDNVRNR